MKLDLERVWKDDKCSIGVLSIDGVSECFTMEDVERDVKIHGETAIPHGTYSVIVSYSQRFKRELPLLVAVPNFTGIRIHPGNTAEDTDGCILPGRTKTADAVQQSRVAFEALFGKITVAIERGEEVAITVR